MLPNNSSIPFNDLYRIHKPLIAEFNNCLTNLIENSEFVNGSETSKFEKNLADIEGMSFAATTSTGTSAIELVLRAFGVGVGDEVITTSFTFVATVHSILQVGAIPVLVDVNESDCLMNPELLAESITSKTKVILVVSLHGRLDYIDEYRRIADKFGLYLILDASQSHLAMWNNCHQGKFFDAMTLSFYPGKNLGSLGEGGAVLSDNPKIIDNIKIMRDWGAERKYEHDSWGGNYRMQTIQSAFLNIKFPFLTEWTAERKKLADFYTNSLPVKFLRSKTSGSGDNVYHIFDLLIEDRDKFITFMKQNGVSTAIHYPRAIHQHNAYKHLVVLKRPCDQAIIQVRKTVSIPLFPGLTINEQQTIINLIHEYHIYAH